MGNLICCTIEPRIPKCQQNGIKSEPLTIKTEEEIMSGRLRLGPESCHEMETGSVRSVKSVHSEPECKETELDAGSEDDLETETVEKSDKGKNKVKKKGGPTGEIHLTDEELEELKDIFAMFDKDNSGSIDVHELETMVSSLGISATKDDLNEMIAEADIDKSGTIEFEEFKTLIGPHFQKEKPPEDFIDAFKFFDKDGDGFISRTELRAIMNNVDGQLAEADIEDMIKEADVNGDGKIDFDEFIKMMHHQPCP